MKPEPERTYPFCLDLRHQPVSHNQLIGPIQAITLENIRGTLGILLRLLRENEETGLKLNAEETQGLACTLGNAFKALDFEQYHRQLRPYEYEPGDEARGD